MPYPLAACFTSALLFNRPPHPHTVYTNYSKQIGKHYSFIFHKSTAKRLNSDELDLLKGFHYINYSEAIYIC